MDSYPPPQQSLLDGIDKKMFPAKLWSLVNDPANDSIFWDSRGEEVIINQCLFEKEVLSQGCGLPDTFKSFHRQLNLYRFKNVHGNGVKMGYRHFSNPNFKRGYPEPAHQLTRNTVKNRLKTVAHQKTHRLPHKNEKFLAGGKGCASSVPLKNTTSVDHSAALPPHVFQVCEEMPVYHLEYSSQSFSPTGFYQATHCLIQPGSEESTTFPSPGENSQWENGDINLDLVFQMADELMPLPSPSNVQFVLGLHTSNSWIISRCFSPAVGRSDPHSVFLVCLFVFLITSASLD
uniref:HSF-type DNA-binding domain-containing protein n=1 Tax=Gouania willdenowi TaxID=441366 RepID=A0A8C5GYK8_GOUWI